MNRPRATATSNYGWDSLLDPTPGSRLLDVEVESVPVAVPTGRSGAHEGGRQPLVGMAALGLASSAFGGRSIHIIHPPIVAGMERDCKGRRWTNEVGGILPKVLGIQDVTNSYERYWTPSDSVRPTCAAILPRRALPAGRLGALDADAGFLHGLLGAYLGMGVSNATEKGVPGSPRPP